MNNFGCYNQSKCVGQKEEPRKNLLFCCCEGDYCNKEFSWEPLATETPPTIGMWLATTNIDGIKLSHFHVEGVPPLRSSQGKPILNTLMYTLVPIVAITFMVIIGYWMYRRQRMAYFNEVTIVCCSIPNFSSPFLIIPWTSCLQPSLKQSILRHQRSP